MPKSKTKPKRKRGNRAGKGSSFEREICRLLSVWWTGDSDADVIFWRTSQSGGRATARRKTGRRTAAAHCGDLAAIAASGEPLTRAVVFELKRGYRTAALHDLLDRPVRAAAQVWEEWIAQAQEASANAGTRYWAVIHRRDRRECLIVVPRALLWNLGFNDPAADFPPPVVDAVVELTAGKKKNRVGLVAMPLGAFLAAVTPDMICGLK
jgi:hypothetical protein